MRGGRRRTPNLKPGKGGGAVAKPETRNQKRRLSGAFWFLVSGFNSPHFFENRIDVAPVAMGVGIIDPFHTNISAQREDAVIAALRLLRLLVTEERADIEGLLVRRHRLPFCTTDVRPVAGYAKPETRNQNEAKPETRNQKRGRSVAFWFLVSGFWFLVSGFAFLVS